MPWWVIEYRDVEEKTVKLRARETSHGEQPVGTGFVYGPFLKEQLKKERKTIADFRKAEGWKVL